MEESKKKKPSGSLPDTVTNQIVEHTVGGFVLFYFNSETGEPEQIMTFDSPAHSLALQKTISDWIKVVERVNFENSIHSLNSNIDEQQEGENEEG